MAERVQEAMEAMVIEVEEMERVGILKSNEVKELIRKRKQFEYKINRQTHKKKEDYLSYIQYERNLINLIKLRRNKINYSHKEDVIEYLIYKRINNLFSLLCAIWKSDIKLWLSHIDWLKEVHWVNVLSRVFMKALQIHSSDPKLWIAAAKYEFGRGDADTGRQILLRALRFHPQSKLIHREYIKFELLYVQKLLARQKVLKIQKKEVEDSSDKQEEKDVEDEENEDQAAGEESDVEMNDEDSGKEEEENVDSVEEQQNDVASGEEDNDSDEQVENDAASEGEVENDAASGDEVENEAESEEEIENDAASGDEVENDAASGEEVENDVASGEEENDEASDEEVKNDVASGEEVENDKASGEEENVSGSEEDNDIDSGEAENDAASGEEEENEAGNSGEEVDDNEDEQEKEVSKKEEINDSGDESVEDKIMNCDLVNLVVKSALDAVEEPEFAVSLLMTARIFSFSGRVQENIIEVLEDKFPDHPVTVDTLARMQLEKEGKASELVKNCVAVYKAALNTAPSTQLFHFAITTLKELGIKVVSCDVLLVNSLLDICELGHQSGHLAQQEYEFYLQLINIHNSSEFEEVLDHVLVKFPNHLLFWKIKLQHNTQVDEMRKTMNAAHKALKDQDDLSRLWQRFMELMAKLNKSEEAYAYLEEKAGQLNLAFLRVLYLDRAYEKGIKKAREVYKSFQYKPPFNSELHKNILTYELEQPKVDKVRIRKIYEVYSSQFGSEEIQIWLDWISWETRFGHVMEVPNIICRAESKLKPELVNKFNILRENI